MNESHFAHIATILMGIIGGILALFAWGNVFLIRTHVALKGGNRALLSVLSRVAVAVAITSWCLALTGFYPMIWAGLFAVSVIFAMVESRRARAARDPAHGLTPNKQFKMTFAQMWPALCLFDGLLLVPSLYAVLRDLRTPPNTEDQRIVHIIAVGYLVASVLGAIVLYVKRPRTRA